MTKLKNMGSEKITEIASVLPVKQQLQTGFRQSMLSKHLQGLRDSRKSGGDTAID